MTIIGAVLAALSFVEVRYQATAAFEQLKVMQGDQRPWVYAQPHIQGNVTERGNYYAFPVSFELLNTGHAPAFDLTFLMKIDVVREGAKLQDFHNSDCDDQKSGRGAPYLKGSTLFPGQSGVWESPVLLLDKTTWLEEAKKGRVVGALVYGCVDYLLSLDDRHHQTPVGLLLGGGSNQGVSAFPADPTTVPVGAYRVSLGAALAAD